MELDVFEGEPDGPNMFHFEIVMYENFLGIFLGQTPRRNTDSPTEGWDSEGRSFPDSRMRSGHPAVGTQRRPGQAMGLECDSANAMALTNLYCKRYAIKIASGTEMADKRVGRSQ